MPGKKYFFSKEDLSKLYLDQKKSIRMIVSELKTTRSVIGFYLEKFGIKRRTKSEAIKERIKRDPNWGVKFFKNAEQTRKKATEASRKHFKELKEVKIKEIEHRFGSKINVLLYRLYIEENKSLSKISKIILVGRNILDQLMQENNIKKRPSYCRIVNLRGKKHPFYGKTWEEIYAQYKFCN